MRTKNLKMSLAILLTLVFMLSLIPATVLAAVNGDVTLTIIHVNDRHGRMSADPYISQLAKDTKGNVLILDAGDALHGQITANLTKGAAMIELMNNVGYSAMVTGNHEFTYGLERLSELSELSDFPLLAANVKDSDGKNLFQSCAVFEMDGVTVGVFGLVTPETIASSDPRLMTGIVFDDPAETAKSEVSELKAEGCDIIIALTHLGLDDLSDAKNRSDSLANVPGIDVIIDGHSHTELPDGLIAGDTLISQTGEYGENIGVVEINISGGKVSKTAKLIPVPSGDETSELTADEAVVSIIEQLDKANEAVTSVVVGYTPVFLQGEKTASRIGETNLADLITDSMRLATGADMAFLSGGNIRASIDAGDITMGEVLTTLPYSNLLTTVELTGADILKILEHGVELYPEAVGQYIHVSGLSFHFDQKAEAGSRVKLVTMLDGTVLASAKTYTVATIDFIAAGGDGYDTMLNGKNLKYYGGDAEVFVDYLATKPIINAEPEHRVCVYELPSFSDVSESAWYYAAVTRVTEEGYMVTGDTFNPNGTVTQEEACELLDKLLPYADVTHTTGDSILTREALAVMLDSSIDEYLPHDESGVLKYSDEAAVNPDYLSAVMHISNTGIMRGVGGGRFDPKGIVTRAQMATVMYNIINASLKSAEAPRLSDTDYSNMDNWLRFGGDTSKEVDVFMIYPTVTTSLEAADRPNVRLDSEVMKMAATGWLMENEGLVIESANIYAPLYRQLNGVELESLNSETFLSNTNATPRDDIFAAFDYYLTNVNKGERPFILLGHSQGGQLVTELSTTFLGSAKYSKYNKNLIIAYAIGVSVTEDQLAKNSNIKFSQSAEDTGVLVSWNTTAPSEDAAGTYKEFGTWRTGALMTNPISWTTDEAPASAESNKASLVFAADGTPQMIEKYADAIIDKEHSILLNTAVDEAGYISMSSKVSKFHRYDIAFYYGSIQQNIKDRIAAFNK